MKKQIISSIESIPRSLGFILIPDLLPDHSKRRGESKLRLSGHCQTDSYSCGVAAGWSALKFLIPGSNLERFDFDCRPNTESGTSSERLMKALRKHGASVSTGKLGFAMIAKNIRAGKPVLTAIHLRHDVWHWVAIYGFARKPQRVYLSGRLIPGFSSHWLPWSELRRRNGPWLALVVSRGAGLNRSGSKSGSASGGPGGGLRVPSGDEFVKLVGSTYIKPALWSQES